MSCTDVLFCTSQNTNSGYGVDVSIFDKCHHNIIFGKVNVHVLLALVCFHEVWNYSQANVGKIKDVISNFNWSKVLANLCVEGQVRHFNKTLLNVFRNYIPNITSTSLD